MHGDILKFWKPDSFSLLLKLQISIAKKISTTSGIFFIFYSQVAERYLYYLAIPWQLSVQCTVCLQFYSYISNKMVGETSRYKRLLHIQLQTI